MRRLTLLPLLFAASAALSQTPDTAILDGTVLDSTHATIAGAKIHITDNTTGVSHDITSTATGHFTLESLAPGSDYTITATANGFATATRGHIAIAAGSRADVHLTLKPAGDTSTVTVEGAATDLNITEPQSGIYLSHDDIQSLPLINRRISFLPLLNAANRPAINQGDIFMNQFLFTTNGGGRRQQTFVVDGAPDNDSWGRQTLFTNIPESAVAEMSVLTNSFSAAYGASTGSVVNIITRSGSNNWHGDLLQLYRPAKIEARYFGYSASTATSGNQVSGDQLEQTAGSLGGKLFANDPTFFFFAGEFSRQRRTSSVTSAISPGSFMGHYRDILTTLRLDRASGPRNNAFARFSTDGFYDTNPNGIVGGTTLPTVARTFYRNTYTAELGDTATISPRLVNNLRAQFQLASPITQFVPAQPGTQFSVPITGGPTFTTGTSQSALLLNHQYGVDETLSAPLGKHQLSVGGDWLLSHTGGNSKEFGGPYFLGRFVYNPCNVAGYTLAQLITYCESSTFLNNIANVATYTQGYGNPSYTISDNLFAIFAQDDYHFTQRLTLNLGVRYERQTFTDSTTNFGPRAGFVFDALGDGSTVVRGGFGMYYSQIVDNSQANYTLAGPAYVNFTVNNGQAGFPTSIASAPLPALGPGAVLPVRQIYIRPGRTAYYNQFFDATKLVNYPNALLNPYSEQYSFGIEQRLPGRTTLEMDYVGTHTVHNVRPLDVDAPTPFIRTAQNQTRASGVADCTRPLWVAYYANEGLTCAATSARSTQPNFNTIQSDVNDGYAHYNSLNVNVRHSFGSQGMLLASYVWSHTTDNVDPDTTSQNPNDANFPNAQERGNAIYDQRNRGVVSGYYFAPLKIQLGGVLTLAGGLPYNLTTGTTNSGDTSGTTDRPVINGVVVGRNTGRGTPIYAFDPFVARAFSFHDIVHLTLRAEAFNVANHANYVGFISTYGNNATAPTTLGQPSGAGITAQLPPRMMQFEARISF